MGREAEVGYYREGDVRCVKASHPLIFGLVLELELEVVLLEVGEAAFCGDACATDSSGLEGKGALND